MDAIIARHIEPGDLLYKSHFVETASLAYLVSQIVPEVVAYGGISTPQARLLGARD